MKNSSQHLDKSVTLCLERNNAQQQRRIQCQQLTRNLTEPNVLFVILNADRGFLPTVTAQGHPPSNYHFLRSHQLFHGITALRCGILYKVQTVSQGKSEETHL